MVVIEGSSVMIACRWADNASKWSDQSLKTLFLSAIAAIGADAVIGFRTRVSKRNRLQRFDACLCAGHERVLKLSCKLRNTVMEFDRDGAQVPAPGESISVLSPNLAKYPRRVRTDVQFCDCLSG